MNKNTVKKIITVVVSVLFVACVLCGCGRTHYGPGNIGDIVYTDATLYANKEVNLSGEAVADLFEALNDAEKWIEADWEVTGPLNENTYSVVIDLENGDYIRIDFEECENGFRVTKSLFENIGPEGMANEKDRIILIGEELNNWIAIFVNSDESNNVELPDHSISELIGRDD